MRPSGAAAALDWHYRPSLQEWSLTELMCHLRDVEREVHQVRFRDLITTDNAFIAGADPDRWTEERGYQQQDGERALEAFAAARQITITLLQDLPEAMWQRRGRHAFFGPTSMHELLHLVVQHDRAHWQQVQLIMH
ncbi:MAG: DinB family protein [Chloroflexi bacterium]|nr:DinB family protein [Chloroflexota bacterium]